MEKRKFTVGCKYALIIIAAHNVGVEVGMLDDAERGYVCVRISSKLPKFGGCIRRERGMEE